MGENIVQQYYYELSVKPEVYYELFLDLILSLTTEAIQEVDETIIIRSQDSLEDIKEGIEAFKSELENAFDTKIQCDIILEQKENQDWIKVYQQSVQPIAVEQFYIHPSWNELKDGYINISIDPTLAFGSGHHETTASCLRAISKYVKKDMSVCDVGCGSGILGIAAAKLDANVDICDTDDVAVQDALKNFKTNNLTPNKAWEGSATKANTTYDVVIANIVADVLIFIHKDLKKITKDGGVMILSGIMNQYSKKVVDKFLQDSNYVLIEQIDQNEWTTLIIKKVQ